MHTGCALHHQTIPHLFAVNQVAALSYIFEALQTSSQKCHQAAASGLEQIPNS